MDDILPELRDMAGPADSGPDEPVAQATSIKPHVQRKAGKEEYEGLLTVDVYQTETDIVIRSTIAGVTADDLDISITNDMVTVKGVRHTDHKIPSERYYYQELFWGPFSRSIILPEEIDADKATATLKNGILTLTLPKLSKTREKKLRVLG